MLLCCTVYLPGFFSIPPVDRDESRFAQASRQMFESVALPEAERDPELHSGGLAVPMVGGKPRLNKPPLIYWLQAGSAAVFTGGDPLRDAIWMYRAPSLLAGLVIVLATWRIGCSMFDPQVGWVGACLLAVAPVFVWEAHQARSDMVMVAWTVLAMGRLWKLWRGPGATDRRPVLRPTDTLDRPHWSSTSGARWVSIVLLWVFTALGILTKGPITPMVVLLTGLTLAALSRAGKEPRPVHDPARPTGFRWFLSLHPLLGLLIAIAALAPWVYAVARQVGFETYWHIVYDEVLGRAGSAKEGHWGPPGYHLVLLVVLFWPGSLLTGLSIGRAWRKGRRSRGRKLAEGATDMPEDPEQSGGAANSTAPPASLRSRLRSLWTSITTLRVTRRPEAFLLAWMLPSWLTFELIGTKLPHYTMPLYPAVALLTARVLLAWPSLRPAAQRGAINGAWIWLLVGLVLFVVVGLGVVFSIGSPLAPVALGLLPLAMLCFIPTVREVRRGDLLRAQRYSMPLAMMLLVSFLWAAAPGFFGLSRIAARTAAELAPGRPVTWVGFNEDSVVWLSRGKPSFTKPQDIDSWFGAHPDGLAIISVYAEDAYVSRPVEFNRLALLFGFDYTKGRFEKLAIVERLPE